MKRSEGKDLRGKYPGEWSGNPEDNRLILVRSGLDYAEKIDEYRAEFPADRIRVTYVRERIPGMDYLEDYGTATEWLSFCDTMEGKISWYMTIRPDDGKIIGFSCLRHSLEYDDDDFEFASNIGYSIRPSEQKKGYGKEQLRLVLREAGKLGMKQVRIVCCDSNAGSNRIITANGGIFIDSLYGEESGITINRYDVPVVICNDEEDDL